ncbi:RDD family protein [Nocardia coubleae]|uniref:RDD family protein n=1 Tax=Nocardia coubleae TaxID=356147 RepID=A0A846W365_9NOCA|nr:RDD family protein [Nocardia coubleae]NKX87230.1 RDD family protein [Nocardia coubleae]
MAEFTTGEAVALELPIARIPSRAGAFLLDLMLQLTLAFGLFYAGMLMLLWSAADEAWMSVLAVVTIVTVLVGYPVCSETLTRGRSLGKMAFGLRVVRADAGPTDFRHALTRGLAGAIVDFWMLGGFGAVAVITSLCSRKGRRVGDVLAGTVVVHTRQQLPRPALAAAPPWLTGWAAQLDPTDLSDDLATAARQYLTRLRTLTPAAQHHLGTKLAESMCAAVRTQVPAGYPPYHVIGAILSRRQQLSLH